MLTIKQVKAGIASLAKSNEKRSDVVHKLLVSVTGHLFAHGDTRQVDSLLSAFSKGTDKKAIRQWLTTYAPVTFDAAIGKFKFSNTKKDAADFDEAFLLSDECIRWDSDTDNGNGEVNPLDVYARLTRLLKDADKARADGKREVIHAGLVSELSALATKYKSEAVDPLEATK